MSKEIRITLPIYWRNKLVGMNWYRNAHFYAKAAWKQEFTELISKQVEGAQISSPYGTRMELHYRNTSCDAGNVTALSEKVTLDALQSAQVTVGDSVKHHIKSEWTIAGQDKADPRCEIVVYEL